MGDLEGREDLPACAFASDAALVLLPGECAGEDDDEQGCDGGQTCRSGDCCREPRQDPGSARGKSRGGLGVGRDLLHDAGGEAGRCAAGPEGLAQLAFQIGGLEFEMVEVGVIGGFELAVAVNHGCTP